MNSACPGGCGGHGGGWSRAIVYYIETVETNLVLQGNSYQWNQPALQGSILSSGRNVFLPPTPPGVYSPGPWLQLSGSLVYGVHSLAGPTAGSSAGPSVSSLAESAAGFLTGYAARSFTGSVAGSFSSLAADVVSTFSVGSFKNAALAAVAAASFAGPFNGAALAAAAAVATTSPVGLGTRAPRVRVPLSGFPAGFPHFPPGPASGAAFSLCRAASPTGVARPQLYINAAYKLCWRSRRVCVPACPGLCVGDGCCACPGTQYRNQFRAPRSTARGMPSCNLLDCFIAWDGRDEYPEGLKRLSMLHVSFHILLDVFFLTPSLCWGLSPLKLCRT
ncbi:uncharacterized protein LOC109282406 [Alligator mississippiensis]|uniref:uncharacterized protein LOC109282406 n=1 Tax=Alligator mississippiensis TaxID=8496 RepID=UPI0028777E3F|nr:uncharacterized protein LOC109282406 [Alligator mississippiensis]